MDFLLNNYEILITLLVAVFGVFKWQKAVKYAEFIKEVIDIPASYKKGSADDEWTNEEKLDLADQVIEAIKKGEETFAKEKFIKKR